MKRKIVLENIPDDWTDKDVFEALTIGMFIKSLKKYPQLLEEIKKKAKKYP